jgi:aldehyde:ferredoxin oxidoreductase
VQLVKNVTGWDVSVDELMAVGRRRLNLLRAFNAREGFDRKDDKLPHKLYGKLAGSGPSAGVGVEPTAIEAALDQYYQLNGWTKNGIPTADTLRSLNLDWAVQYISG